MSSTVRNVLVSLAIAAVFLFLAFRSVSLEELRGSFARFDAWWLIPAVVISLL